MENSAYIAKKGHAFLCRFCGASEARHHIGITLSILRPSHFDFAGFFFAILLWNSQQVIP